MSLVKKDEMTTLRPASEAKSTSDTALDEIQLAAVAFAINNASNTGEYTAIFQEPLSENTKEQLESNGYTIKYVHTNAYNDEKHALIIWRDAKPGDLITEPSNSGPKYNTKREEEAESEELVEEPESEETTSGEAKPEETTSEEPESEDVVEEAEGDE